MIWPFKARGPEPFSSSDVQAQAEAIRAAWAEAYRQTAAGRAMGLLVRFSRKGIGDPSVGPLDYRPDLKIYRSEEL